ncbi:hypothetical protein HDU67_004086, partial [Dinochytrium kinnereticum]
MVIALCVSFPLGSYITGVLPTFIYQSIQTKMQLAELYETDEEDVLVFLIAQHVELAARWMVSARMSERQRKVPREGVLKAVRVFRKGCVEFLDD